MSDRLLHLAAQGIAGNIIAYRMGITPARVSQRLRQHGRVARQQEAWTADEAALLRAMWLSGASASEIAARLGSPRTREAVLGKAHRLGICPRPSSLKSQGGGQ